MFRICCGALLFALVIYTQCTHLLSVPGLHFDEAWQGLLAHKIANEPTFWPISAMNSYTTPVVHYLLALAFKVFGETLGVMRGFYAALNLSTFALIAAWLWRAGERKAMAWFALIWALLPLSVHDHRFYIEMTGFFGFCLAIMLWGMSFWRTKPLLSALLTVIPLVAATYSHILFIAVPMAALLALPLSYARDFRTARARTMIGATALLLLPLPLHMGFVLGKAAPFGLAATLLAVAAWAATGWHWEQWPRQAMRLVPLMRLACIPFLIMFIGLLWNGFWPYAQATGTLKFAAMPFNAILFLGLAYLQIRWRWTSSSRRDPDRSREIYKLSPHVTWNAFTAVFFFTSILILKQSPRYYMVSAILAMIWSAQRLARLHSKALQAGLATTFAIWNFYAFHESYINPYEKAGATTHEFKLAFFHDNARDFRPFQKAVSWALKQQCRDELHWVEDDRFLLPMEFLKLSAPPSKGSCPWHRDELFFSHIPDYDPNFSEPRTEYNTPPPAGAENVKFLAHFPEWGDLAFWIRRK